MIENNQGNESIQQNEAPPVEEKRLPQSEVNELVRAQKEKAFTRGYQQAASELQQKTPVPPAIVPQNASVQGVDSEQMRKVITEQVHAELQQKQHEQNWQGMVNRLVQKVESAKADFPDFEQVTSNIPLAEIPHVIPYLDQFPDAGAILHDLGKNPSKLAAVASASPGIAMAMLRDLSSSIQQNKAAQNIKLPPDPLDQSKPSAISTDNGGMTLADMKARYRA